MPDEPNVLRRFLLLCVCIVYCCCIPKYTHLVFKNFFSLYKPTVPARFALFFRGKMLKGSAAYQLAAPESEQNALTGPTIG